MHAIAKRDARDVEELLTSYRVADYLEAFEENRRQVDQGVRERLIKEGIRLSERLSPLEGVLSTSTHFMLKTYKRFGVLMHQETPDERLTVTP